MRRCQGGQDLLSWCTRNGMAVMDTFFAQPMRKRHAWWHPADHLLAKEAVFGPCMVFVQYTRIEGERGRTSEATCWGHGQQGRGCGAPQGRVHWDNFTDHLPVKLQSHFWPMQNRATTERLCCCRLKSWRCQEGSRRSSEKVA